MARRTAAALWLLRLSITTMSPGAQGWHLQLDDPGQEIDGVDRPVEHAGRDDPVASQTSHEGQRFPMTMRHLGEQTLAHGAASMRAGHVRLGPGLIDKDDALGIDLALMPAPSLAAPRDIMAILFAGVQSFFLKLRPA